MRTGFGLRDRFAALPRAVVQERAATVDSLWSAAGAVTSVLVAGLDAGREVKAAVTAIPAQAWDAVGRQLDEWADWMVPLIVDELVSRINLTDLVAQNVDLNRIVADVDVDAVVWRVDLLALAQYVVDGIDLPDIVRNSSASLTTEAVHRLREHGVDADDAVSRAVSRLIPHRR
jgi:hypothetical protein